MLNFADNDKEVEFNDCAGDCANSGRPARNSLNRGFTASGDLSLQALSQFRRSYAIGMGVFAISLPFSAMSIDSWAAAPQSSRPMTGAVEPTIPVSEAQKPTPGDIAEARQHKNVKLN